MFLAGLALEPAASLANAPSPGAATAGTVKLPDGPGSVRGLADAASVDVFSGQLTYSVPIDLPTGRGGFGPSAALSYNGALGNGPVGIGWSMSAPSIRRSTRQGVPSYDQPGATPDVLELVGIGGGGRLVWLTEGPYVGQWRAEGQGHNTKIEPWADGPGDVATGFKVTTSDGTKYFLGTSPESRQVDPADPSRVAVWFVQRIQNLAGDEVHFTYLHDDGQAYLGQIAWGPAPSGVNGCSEDTMFRAEFAYDTQRPDPVVSYRNGFREVTRWRLDGVHVMSMCTLLRSYHLSYDDSFPVARLSGVVMTGLEGEGQLPALTFGYAGAWEPDYATVPNSDGWELGERGTTLLDVDGDGLQDLARFEQGRRSWRRNQGVDNGFGPELPLEGGMPLDLDEVRLMDLTADSVADLVYQVGETWRVYRMDTGADSAGADNLGAADSSLSTGPRFVPLADTHWPGSKGVDLQGPQVAYADVNGDGRTDVLEGGADSVWVRFATDGGLAPAVRRGPLSENMLQLEVGDPDARWHDLNGDGLTDVLWVLDGRMRVLLGRGDGTFEDQCDVYATGGEPGRVAYPWGDDYVDLETLRLADLNRDGLTDLVRLAAGHVYYWAGMPGGFSGQSATDYTARLARPDWAEYDDTVQIVDLNGNGSQDIVWSGPVGMTALDLAGPTSAGMLSTIENGLGAVTSYTYTPSTQMMLEAEATGVAELQWRRRLPTSIPVPSGTVVQTGLQGEPDRAVSHVVRDGFWDAEERRFGGFLVGVAHTEADTAEQTLVVETHYIEGVGMDRALRGKPAWVFTRDGTGKLYHEGIQVWDTLTIPDLPDDHPWLRVAVQQASVTNTYEGECVLTDGAGLQVGAAGADASGAVCGPRVTKTTYEHDDQGRVIRQVAHGNASCEVMNPPDGCDGYGATAGDEVATETLYADNDSLWIRGVTCSSRALSAEGELISYGLTRYAVPNGTQSLEAPPTCDVNADTLCACDPGYGRPVSSWAWLHHPLQPGADQWVNQSRVVYDDFWNPILNWAAGIWTRLEYDDFSFRPISETVDPETNDAPGGPDPQSESALTWTISWDHVRGVPVEMTEPRDPSYEGTLVGKTRVEHDSLGRLTATQIPNETYDGWLTVTSHEYDWEGGDGYLPRTWTHTHHHDDTGSIPDNTQVAVTNGVGEEVYTANWLDDPDKGDWVINGFQVRDRLGKPIRAYNPWFYSGDLPGTLPVALPDDVPYQTLVWDVLGRQSEQILPATADQIADGWTEGAKKTIQFRLADPMVGMMETETWSQGLSPIISISDGFGRAVYSGRTVIQMARDGRPERVQVETVHTLYSHAGTISGFVLQKDTPKEVVHSYWHDSFGRLIRSEDPDIGERTYDWDARGNLIRTTNGEEEAVAYTYDGLNRLTAKALENDNHGDVFTFVYDEYTPSPAGNKTDCALVPGAEMHVRSRLAEVWHDDGNMDKMSKCMAYNAQGSVTHTQRRVRDLVISDRTDYTVGGLVRMSATYLNGLSEVFPLGGNPPSGPALRTLSRYDRMGSLVDIAVVANDSPVPSWEAILSDSVDFDNVERIWTRSGYNAAGAVNQEIVGNGYVSTYERDVLGAVKNIKISNPYDSGDAATGSQQDWSLDLRVWRNATGSITRTLDSTTDGVLSNSPEDRPTRNSTFSYDTRGRLTCGTLDRYRFTYGYDELQNMNFRDWTWVAPDEGGTTCAVDASSHAKPVDLDILTGTMSYGNSGIWTAQLPGTSKRQVQDSPGNEYSLAYDKAGRIVHLAASELGERELGFDASERLRRLVVNGEVVEYQYDSQGQKTAQCGGDGCLTAQSSQTVAAWFGPSIVWDGTTFVQKILVGDRPVASIALAQGLEVEYLHRLVGAGPTLTTKEALHQDLLWSPFGVLISKWHAETGQDSGDDGTVDYGTYSILNRPVDPASMWSDHGARWFIPELGQWATTDPLAGSPEGILELGIAHPTAYSRWNPIRHWDPDGMKDIVVAFSGGSGDGLIPEDPHRAPADDAMSQIVHRATGNTYQRSGTTERPVVSLTIQGSLADGEVAEKFRNKLADTVASVYEAGDRLVLIGYSMGGNHVLKLAEKMKDRGIGVDLLVNVDHAYGPWTDDSPALAPSNVDTLINFYQTNTSAIGSRGAPFYRGNRQSGARGRVYNRLVFDTSHAEMLGLVADNVVSLVNSFLNSDPSKDWDPSRVRLRDPRNREYRLQQNQQP